MEDAAKVMITKFAEDGAWDDIGHMLNWTELFMIIEAAREVGLDKWADEFHVRASEQYDPEGYWDSKTSE